MIACYVARTLSRGQDHRLFPRTLLAPREKIPGLTQAARREEGGPTAADPLKARVGKRWVARLSWSTPRWLRSMGRLPVRNRLRNPHALRDPLVK
jgi:hypothetical protein